MEVESKPSERDESRAPDSSSDNDSDSDSDTGNGPTSNSDSQTTTALQVEWLATTRQRRSTAGNRMKSMLANEEPDSDLELLFAEDENDQGFSDAEDDGSDMQMDSTDDEDENNNADDDLEGEKELEKQAKERRAAQRKRGAQEAIPAKFRKKVRIDPTTPTAPAPAPAPRPKKKSERTSWLPSPADMPTRASSRKTTRISKEQLHQQMVEREAKRLKQLAQMQKKAERLEALKKPPMTQEERLREAAIVEKRNAKSLNRWEEAEKQREEERRAKLAALNNRTLKGPVITFWSGIGEWMGKNMVVEEAPKKKRERADKKEKGKGKDKEKAKNATPGTKEVGKGDGEDGTPVANNSVTKPEPESDQGSQPPQTALQQTPSQPPAQASVEEGDSAVPIKIEKPPAKPIDTPSGTEGPAVPKPEELPQTMAISPSPSGLAAPSPLQPTTGGLAAPVAAPTPPPISLPDAQRSVLTPPPGLSRPPESKPSGVLALPMLAPPPGIAVNGTPPMLSLGLGSGSPKSNVLAPPITSQGAIPPTLASIAPPAMTSTSMLLPLKPAPSPNAAASVSAPSIAPSIPKLPQSISDSPTATAISKPLSQPLSQPLPQPPSQPPSQVPPEPPQPSTGARNSIIFQNFDENAIKDKTTQTQIIFGRRMAKLAKPSPAPICVITNNPARYRDPKTGLPYYNVQAYREIQRLIRNEYHFSKVLNAWVGNDAFAARGVPERFLNPNGKRSTEVVKKDANAKTEAGAEKQPEVAVAQAPDVEMTDAPAPPVATAPTSRPSAGPNIPAANAPTLAHPVAPIPTPPVPTPAASLPPRQTNLTASNSAPLGPPPGAPVLACPTPATPKLSGIATSQTPVPQVPAIQARPASVSSGSAPLAPALAPSQLITPAPTIPVAAPPAKTPSPLAAPPPQPPSQTPTPGMAPTQPPTPSTQASTTTAASAKAPILSDPVVPSQPSVQPSAPLDPVATPARPLAQDSGVTAPVVPGASDAQKEPAPGPTSNSPPVTATPAAATLVTPAAIDEISK